MGRYLNKQNADFKLVFNDVNKSLDAINDSFELSPKRKEKHQSTSHIGSHQLHSHRKSNRSSLKKSKMVVLDGKGKKLSKMQSS